MVTRAAADNPRIRRPPSEQPAPVEPRKVEAPAAEPGRLNETEVSRKTGMADSSGVVKTLAARAGSSEPFSAAPRKMGVLNLLTATMDTTPAPTRQSSPGSDRVQGALAAQHLASSDPGSITADSAREYLRLIAPGMAGKATYEEFVSRYNKYSDRFSPAARAVMEEALATPNAGWQPIVGGAQDALRFPQYDRMLEDGRLEVMVGVGYDDNWERFGASSSEEYQASALGNISDDLLEAGFKSAQHMSDMELGELGVKREELDRRFVSYVGRTHDRSGKACPVIVKLVSGAEGKAGAEAAEAFAERFGREDVVIYAGHGRHGTGPDFDPVHSSGGNVVFNDAPVPYTEEAFFGSQGGGSGEDVELVLEGGKQLANMDLQPDKYQLILMDGCRTTPYLDALRRQEGFDEENKDVIASNQKLMYMGASSFTIRPGSFIAGVAEQQSVNKLVGGLADTSLGYNDTFNAYGLLDNDFRPPVGARLAQDAFLAEVARGKRTLEPGNAQRKATALVQQYLRALDVPVPVWTDGDYDEATELAVSEFQRSSGLEVKGKVDRDTVLALERAMQRRRSEWPHGNLEHAALTRADELERTGFMGALDEATDRLWRWLARS